MDMHNPARPGELLTGYWLAMQTQRDPWTARASARKRKRIKRMAGPDLQAT